MMAARQFLRQFVALRPCMTSASRLMGGKSHSHCLGKQSPWTRSVVSPASFHTSTIHHNEHIINIQDTEDFTTRVLENSTPVLVDFHADWCGPCKMLGPRLESMVAEKEGKVILAKVDVDENSELAMDHGVQAVPTVLAVKSGKIVDQFVGMKEESDLESFINKLIGA